MRRRFSTHSGYRSNRALFYQGETQHWYGEHRESTTLNSRGTGKRNTAEGCIYGEVPLFSPGSGTRKATPLQARRKSGVVRGVAVRRFGAEINFMTWNALLLYIFKRLAEISRDPTAWVSIRRRMVLKSFTRFCLCGYQTH